MNKLLLRQLLILTKSPKRLYNIISTLSAKIMPSSSPLNYVEERDKYEKVILLSAAIFDFNPNKDMQSNFMKSYINEITIHIIKYFKFETLCDTFVSMSIGAVFNWQYGGNHKEKEEEAIRVLKEFVTDRIILYKTLLSEIKNGENQSFSILMSAIGEYGFCPMSFSMWREHWDYHELPDHVNDKQSYFKDAVNQILRRYFDLIKVPNDTKLTKTPDSERYHTEQNLAFLNIDSSNFVSFEKISGCVDIECQDCKKICKHVIAFIHGGFNAEIGRQCPKCGNFCSEHNESQEYHQFGQSIDDFCCPKCHYTIRHKDESIFKGNANPIFCPHCHSTKLRCNINFLS